MAHIFFQVDGVTQWDGEVEDWNVPPTTPQAPGVSIRASDLPPTFREALGKALCAAIEKATGFKFRQV